LESKGKLLRFSEKPFKHTVLQINMDLIRVITRDELEITTLQRGGSVVDVTNRGKQPWRTLSPFHVWQQDIPIPGRSDERSCSVEGIWQGLKVIDGVVDKTQFNGRPHKRTGNLEGHLFGTQILGLAEAREKIYIPAYTYVLEKLAGGLVTDLVSRSFDGPLYLVDVTRNCDYKNTREPLSHAGILRNYLNEKRAALLSDLTKKHNRALMAQGGNGNLYETVDNMFEWHENLVDLLEQKAFGEVLARLADSTDAHIKKYAIALGIRTDAPQMRGVIKSLAQSPDFKNLIATETARKAQ